MNCFEHPNEHAVGICKSCGKGVCRTCAIQLTRGLACSEECRPFVEALARLQSTSIRNIGLISVQRLVQPLLALIFFCTGVYYYQTYGPGFFVWFSFAVGGVLALVSILALVKRAGPGS